LTVLVQHTFLVTYQTENQAVGYDYLIQETTTPLVPVQQAWQLLHNDHPRLFTEATFNYRRNLKPGQIIQAEIVKENVDLAIDFELMRKGHIKATHESTPNMAS
jgi:hypothetical protein